MSLSDHFQYLSVPLEPLAELLELLLLGDVQEELEDRRPLAHEHPLEVVDRVVARAPQRLGREVLDAHDEHVLVVRAVEDADHAVGGRGLVVAPEEVVRELLAGGLLERVHAHARRVRAAQDVLDRAVLARRVDALQDDQQRALLLGVAAAPAGWRSAPTAPSYSGSTSSLAGRSRRCRPGRGRRARRARPARRGSGRSRPAAGPHVHGRAATPGTLAACPPGSCSQAAARAAWARRRRGWTGTARRCCGASCGLVARGAAGPVVVVRAPGQELPPLPARRARGRGRAGGPRPAAGHPRRAARRSDAEVAFVASTDLPFLHPRFVAAVVRGGGGTDTDAAVPHARRPPPAARRRLPDRAGAARGGARRRRPDEARVPLRARARALAGGRSRTPRASATSTRRADYEAALARAARRWSACAASGR